MQKQTLSFESQKEYGYKLLMVPITFTFASVGLYHYDSWLVVVGALFSFWFVFNLFSLYYAYTTQEKTTLLITPAYLQWDVWHNNILIKEVKVFKKDIASIYKQTNYYEESFNGYSLKCTLKNHDTITLSDSYTFRFIKSHEQITNQTHLLYPHNYHNDKAVKQIDSYEKNYHHKWRIFLRGIAKRKGTFIFLKRSLILACSYLLLNPILNFTLDSFGVFDAEFSYRYETQTAQRISPKNLYKVIPSEDGVLAVYKHEGKFYMLFSKNKDYKQSYLCLYDQLYLWQFFDELTVSPHAKIILENLNPAVYREVSMWEYLLKPLWLVNTQKNIYWEGDEIREHIRKLINEYGF